MSDDVPTIAHGGLVLRPWRDDDAAAVLDLAADPEARSWSASLRTVRTEAEAREWITSRRAHDRIDWAACATSTGAVAGRVGLHHFAEEDGKAEIGYAVWPAFRGRGVATAMVEAATRHAFDGLGLSRVVLLHAVGNPASCRVAGRCGFVFEGVERAAFDHGDGVRHHAHRHARLATDPPGPVAPPRATPPSAIEPVEIAAGAWQLRPPSAGEAGEALTMLTDPLTVRFNPAPSVVDLDSARAWCERGADWSDGTHATFSVLEATTGRLAGNVSLWRIDLAENRDASIGYRTAPWARGRGVATAAVAAVTRWAFAALGVERIELPHAVDNEASCRVASKCGFPAEGVLRGAFRADDGSRHDEHLHARLAGDA